MEIFVLEALIKSSDVEIYPLKATLSIWYRPHFNLKLNENWKHECVYHWEIRSSILMLQLSSIGLIDRAVPMATKHLNEELAARALRITNAMGGSFDLETSMLKKIL